MSAYCSPIKKQKKRTDEKLENTNMWRILHFSKKVCTFFEYGIFLYFPNFLKLIPVKLKLKFLKRCQLIVHLQKKNRREAQKYQHVANSPFFQKNVYSFPTWNLSVLFPFSFLFFYRS